jgi:hypothetical protein
LGGRARQTTADGKFVGETPAMLQHQNKFGSEFQNVEDLLHADAMASGHLDPRKLGGYVGEIFEVERQETTRRAILKMLDEGDPIIDDLRNKFGLDPEQWVDDLDDLLYNIDTKGARKAVLDEAARLRARGELVWNTTTTRGPGDELFSEFLDRLYLAHQKNYKDIVHTFHGNVNRANLERLANSPLLWWPLSYQLKAGKWLIDLMTNRALGAQTDLLGAWTLDNLLKNHTTLYERDRNYRDMFDDHPALWRSVSMFLPITPFDMGVFMARWTRYSGSAIGSQLGLWDQDPSYPADPVNILIRSMQIGPQFSADIMSDVFDELTDEE